MTDAVPDGNMTPIDKLVGNMGNPDFANGQPNQMGTTNTQPPSYADLLAQMNQGGQGVPGPTSGRGPMGGQIGGQMGGQMGGQIGGQIGGLGHPGADRMYEPPRQRARRPAARPPVARRPAARSIAPPAAPRRGLDLKFLRPALVVAAIVFVMLRNIAPQIAKRVAMSVDEATGKFTVIGLLMISALSGGMYLGLTEILARFV